MILYSKKYGTQVKNPANSSASSDGLTGPKWSGYVYYADLVGIQVGRGDRMRQFLLLSSLMSLFFYTGFALQSPEGALANPSVPVALESGIAAMGGTPAQVMVTGWGSTTRRPDPPDRLLNERDWAGMERPKVRVYQSHGTTYVALTWTATGATVPQWKTAFQAIERTLQVRSGDYHMSVQLEGKTQSVLTSAELIDRGLDALEVSDRQPWTDGIAASGAGRSPRLPPSRLGLNVQVAARRQAPGYRVWVSWPMVQREY